MSVTMPPGLAIELDEDRLGARRYRCFERGEIVGVDEDGLPAEALDGMAELVDRAAIELLRRDDLVARLHQRVEDEELRGVPDATASAAVPPSSAAMRSSSTAVVGFMMRV